jgi:preprotein translocase subunit YajC
MITSAYAQAPAAGGESFLSMILPLVIIFVIFYFLLIRPQQKKFKAHQHMVSAVRRGDIVVTAGGMVGKVTRVDNDEVQVEIADNVRVRILKNTLADVRSKGEPVQESSASANQN